MPFQIPFGAGVSALPLRKDFRKSHTLDYLNGYALTKLSVENDAAKDVEAAQHLLAALKTADPKLTYGSKLRFLKDEQPKFIPAHVAFDKLVLRFDAFFKQAVHESDEEYHLRKVKIYYFVEDGSISVVEPPVENSGLQQGVLIKRQRLPKNDSEYFTIKDFNLGIDVTFYSKTFRIVDCDSFTQKYLKETEKLVLSSPETIPSDPYIDRRTRPIRSLNAGVSTHNDKLRRFLENDRKVLRFYCIWDDRVSMYGERREFVLHYFLVDDSVEVREVQRPNNGRDSVPILLRRQRLPKTFHNLEDLQDGITYTFEDFRIGALISVLGRKFLIHGCDEYTKQFYVQNLGLLDEDMKPLQMKIEGEVKSIVHEIPPYNGYGSVEDSLGSCRNLVLKPPKKDFLKLLENEHNVLRFVAGMVSKHKEDASRRFVVSYRVADDTLSIYEPPQRNAGIIGGKFLDRNRILKPGSSLSDPAGPSYYSATDLYVGAVIDIFNRKFTLIDADEYVFKYMEDNKNSYPHANANMVKAKFAQLPKATKSELFNKLKAADLSATGLAFRKDFIAAGIATESFSQHELITLFRTIEHEGAGSYGNLFSS